MSIDDCTGEALNMPPDDVVDVECAVMNVSGTIRSPTITEITDNLNDHINDHEKHRINKIYEIVTDGSSTFYTIMHNLNVANLLIVFFDVTVIPQQLLYVHWEPVSNNEIKIVPDVILPANRVIRVLIQ